MKWLAILLFVVLLGTGCHHNKLIKRGDAQFERGEYSAALQNYRAAQQRKPNSKKIRQRIEAAEERLLEDILVQTREAIAAGAYVEAIEYASFGLKEFPRERVIKENVETVVQRVSRAGDEDLDQGYFASALYLYQSLNQNFVGYESTLEPRIELIRKEWNDVLVTRAEAALANEHSARGFLLWAKANELVPGTDKRQKRDALRKEVIDRHAYRTSLELGERASKETRAVADLLLQTPTGPGLPIGGVAMDEDGPGAAIHLVARAQKFDKSRSTRTETVEYQSGVNEVRNPDHHAKRTELNEKRREVKATEEELTRYERAVRRYQAIVDREGYVEGNVADAVGTEAQRGLATATAHRDEAASKLQTLQNEEAALEDELAALPAMIEEPVYANHSYPITTHRMVARMPISGRVEGRDARDTKPFQTVIELIYEDEVYSAQPVIGVEQKTLEIPSEADIGKALHREAADYVFHFVVESFDAYRRRFVEEAIGESDKARSVDLMVTYLLLDTGRADEDVVYSVAEIEDIPNTADFL
ncbi:MAG: hypothetical protein ACNA8W_07095 [Bradymonadaceae bacterium]